MLYVFVGGMEIGLPQAGMCKEVKSPKHTGLSKDTVGERM
jgi:hypothetical protein